MWISQHAVTVFVCPFSYISQLPLVNVPGKNIAADLHMEHLNRLARDDIRFRGANKTIRAIERVGCSIGTLSPVLLQFDTENFVSMPSSRHNTPDPQKDIDVVVDHGKIVASMASFLNITLSVIG